MLATMRNYDQLIETKPAFQAPSFFGEEGSRRIVHQVWDWEEAEYDLHLYIAFVASGAWVSRHYVSRYRALQRHDFFTSQKNVGFVGVEWIEPETSGFYQPIEIARKTA